MSARFYHEVFQDEIANAEKTIAKAKENLKNTTYHEAHNNARELTDWLSYEYEAYASLSSWISNSCALSMSVHFYQPESMTRLQAHHLIDEVKEYYFPDYTETPKVDNPSQLSVNFSNGDVSITFNIYNSYCKQVETGRLVPETITVCNNESED